MVGRNWDLGTWQRNDGGWTESCTCISARVTYLRFDLGSTRKKDGGRQGVVVVAVVESRGVVGSRGRRRGGQEV
jgi:hypothetical protein